MALGQSLPTSSVAGASVRNRQGETRHRRRVGPQVVLGVLMLALTAGLGYLTFRQGWFTTAGQVYAVVAAVRETTEGVRNTSADVATTAKVKAALAPRRASPPLMSVSTRTMAWQH